MAPGQPTCPPAVQASFILSVAILTYTRGRLGSIFPSRIRTKVRHALTYPREPHCHPKNPNSLLFCSSACSIRTVREFAPLGFMLIGLRGCSHEDAYRRMDRVEKQLDLSFIHVSKTNRDEVAEKLAWMDTGVKHPRLFWGRWYRSYRGAAYPIDAGGFPLPGLPASGLFGTCSWNLMRVAPSNVSEFFQQRTEWRNCALVQGDRRTASKSVAAVGNPKALERWYTEHAAHRRYAAISSRNELTFSVPRKDISKLELPLPSWTPGDCGSAPSDISVVFHFSHERPVNKGCKCAWVKVSPADYLTLLEYVPHATTRR